MTTTLEARSKLVVFQKNSFLLMLTSMQDLLTPRHVDEDSDPDFNPGTYVPEPTKKRRKGRPAVKGERKNSKKRVRSRPDSQEDEYRPTSKLSVCLDKSSYRQSLLSQSLVQSSRLVSLTAIHFWNSSVTILPTYFLYLSPTQTSPRRPRSSIRIGGRGQ